MTEHKTLLDNLCRVADGVVALFGKHCEACVHDLAQLPGSLCYIKGNVTRRQAGSPATDMLLRLLSQKNGAGIDHHNYQSTTENGRTLKSSTTLIRNRKGKPVAAFCINFDTTEFYNASQVLLPFLSAVENEDQGETFAHSLDETFQALFADSMNCIGKHPTTMTLEDKINLVSLLKDNGTFRLKGAIEQVAKLMGVTKYTVYNYLKKARNTKEKQKP